MNNFKPMLAASLLPSHLECDDDTVFSAMKSIHYPVLVSVKMDGIRALRMKMPYLASRTLKWIPNEELCGRAISIPIGYDMELWSSDMDYNSIQSIVMSAKSNADKIQFHVLDDFTSEWPYEHRVEKISRDIRHELVKGVYFTYPTLCSDAEDLFAFERYCINKHSEGICFRLLKSPYKFGRSTLNEQYLIKHCRWIYEDCTIIGFKEQYFNSNESRYNDIGKMDRSKSIEGMIPKDTLGAFIVKNNLGVEFDVGNGQGLDEILRKYVWINQDKFLGGCIVVKSKAHGVKNKPRSPMFWGFRKEGY